MKKTTLALVSLTYLLFIPFNYGGNKLGAQTITTISGNGIASYNGDGIQATAAEINEPSGVVLDKLGNVFIADNVNNRVRKIDAITGIISTVAGTGTAGYNGDGIQATAANLYQPWNVALDAAGNIYIGDRNNQRIRKVTVSSGIITTIAGTGTAGYNGDGIQATAADLNYPQGMFIDKTGNVYIADVDGQRIREVNTSGIISTVAGTGTAGYNGDGIQATAAQLYNPATIYVDTLDNIYIPDYFNNEIRKVTAATGIISSVAGNGTGAYNGDGIQATSAELYNPTGVFLDAQQNIYITDYTNQRIRKVDVSTGLISTVAGNGVAGYSGDGGLATLAEIYNPWDVYVTTNAFYFAEFGSSGNRVRKVTIAPLQVNEPIVANGTFALFPNPNNGNFTLQIANSYQLMVNSQIEVYNMLGEKIANSQWPTANSQMQMDLSTRPNGVYFYRLTNTNGVIGTGRFIINK
jgi:trimeric autotransporter adhesin